MGVAMEYYGVTAMMGLGCYGVEGAGQEGSTAVKV